MQGAPRPITIRDVAREAGVAISTVSLALRHSPKITAATRKHVTDVARRLRFVRMPAYAAMGTRKKSSRHPDSRVPVAVIRGGDVRGYEDAQLRKYISSQFAPLGYRADLIPREELGRRPNRVLLARGYGAVIFFYTRHDDSILQEDWTRFVVVCVGRVHNTMPFHTVRFGYTDSSRECFARVHEAGYRRIGLAPLTHPSPIMDDWDRLEGLLGSHLQLIGSFPEIPPLRSAINNLEVLQNWMSTHQPDCVIGFNVSVLIALRNLGYLIPKSLGFAALVVPDNLRDWEMSGMYQSASSLFAVAAELCDHYLCHGVFGRPPFPHETVVAPCWGKGNTMKIKNAAH